MHALRRRLRLDDDSGLTLVELLVVMALMGVVMVLAGAGFVSLTDATQSTEQRSHSNDELRQALEQVARDARAANPIDVQTCNAAVHVPSLVPSCSSPVVIYDRTVSFEIYCAPVGGECGADNLKHVRWQVAGNRLERVVNGGTPRVILRPDPGSSLPIAARKGAVVNPLTTPVFTYLREDGSALQTASPGDLPTAFRDCTRAMRIHLMTITEPGLTARPAELSTTVSLRNYNEVTAC